MFILSCLINLFEPLHHKAYATFRLPKYWVKLDVASFSITDFFADSLSRCG